MWKFLCESVAGTSHARDGTLLQDHSFASPFATTADQGIVLTCADGAGSASCAEVGARVACQTAMRSAMAFVESGRAVGDADEETRRGWARSVHEALAAEAATRGVAPRELACTLLVAVVGRAAAAFVQVGDGAIVILDGGAYEPVFWPQAGEYLNTTFFVTDPTFEQNVQHRVLQQEVAELAVFSDGLQMLALNFAGRAAHRPFFAPMFAALRAAVDDQELIVPLRQFLDSPGVNGRTDDDKTLILATRVEPHDDAAA